MATPIFLQIDSDGSAAEITLTIQPASMTLTLDNPSSMVLVIGD